VHGYRRAYRLAGEGPVRVLVHGIGDSSATWAELIPDRFLDLVEEFTAATPAAARSRDDWRAPLCEGRPGTAHDGALERERREASERGAT
jgi:pimeloyl-ACP methyl ester carboxylesterase